MSATILPEKTLHYPVLLNEVINIITPQNGGTFIDCTFGQGGYSKKILEYPNTRVIAIDRDKNSLHIAMCREFLSLSIAITLVFGYSNIFFE